MEILGHEILSNASIRPFDLTTLPTLSINTSTTDGFIPLSNGGQVIHYFLRSVSIYRQFRVTLMQEYVCKVFLAKDSISD